MVKRYPYLVAVSRLIRLPNLLILGLTQSLIRWSLISPLLGVNGLSLQMSTLLFIVLMVASMLITAGGYVINDYFDRKIDSINDPDDVIVGHSIGLRQTMAIHLAITITGVILGFYVAYKVHYIYLGALFLLGSGILWFYSTTYKRQFLIGNIIVALMTGMVPMLVLLFELPLQYHNYGQTLLSDDFSLSYIVKWVGGFSAFAFILTLAREIIKDAEDIRGDHSYGRRTLPTVAGIGISKAVVIALFFITVVLLLVTWKFYLPDRYTLLYVLVLLILPLIINTFLLIRAHTAKAFHTISLFTKGIMLAGLLYALLANYLIHHYN
jgi:4-hydroxybenzoate polyprenyltransferase